MDSSTSAVDEILPLFARIIFAKANAWRDFEGKLSEWQHDRLADSIVGDLRTCCCLIYPDIRPPEVSEAAYKEWVRLKHKISIHEMHWRNQGKYDREKIFLWEHMTPLSQMREMCLKAKSEEEVLKILKKNVRIAWILKKEDNELTRLGYRVKREDPDKAYREARIVLRKFEK